MRHKLKSGAPVTIVIFGDSVSSGMQIANPAEDAFFGVFHRALLTAFPRADINLEIRGHPGVPVAEALARVQTDVIDLKPDVVTVQFGGNDERLGTNLGDFQRTLAAVVGTIRKDTSAETILVVQPFQQRDADSPFANAIRQVAREQGVVVSDFDRAVRCRPHDIRGWYAPFFNHPREYSCNIMARELWHTFETVLRLPCAVDLQWEDSVSLLDGSEAGRTSELDAVIHNTSGETLEARVSCAGRTRGIRLKPGTTRLPFAVGEIAPIPPGLARTRLERVFCFVDSAAGTCFDTKWLAVQPVVTPSWQEGPDGRGRGRDSEEKEAIELSTAASVVVGRNRWSGSADLSARMTMRQDAKRLYLSIDVRDDKAVFHRDVDEPTMFFGDCVQLNLDCRPVDRQGMPFYDDKVAQFFLLPGYPEPRLAEWSFGDRPERTVKPTPPWDTVTMTSHIKEGGYRIELSLDLACLLPPEVEAGAIGFDVVIDDTDWGSGRDTQMAWAGTAENYLNPAFYGALWLSRSPLRAHTRSPEYRIVFH